MKLTSSLALSLLFAAPCLAQSTIGIDDVIALEDNNGAAPTQVVVEAAAPAPSDDYLRATRRVRRVVRAKTVDGSLSPADFRAALAAARANVNGDEMDALREALAGRVYEGDDFAVPAETQAAAADAIFTANLFPESRQELASGKTFGGTPIPASVREVVARAKLNGAVAYDVKERNDDGEGKYTDYPSISPATENMAFAYTEVTPASLLADKNDTGTHLRVSSYETLDLSGNDLEVTRYAEQIGGTGSISAAYDHAFHPVMPLSPGQLSMLGYAADLDPIAVGEARSRSGNKWSSNAVIMSDGTVHCLPAVRRHADSRGLILTNPALARGHQLLWNGHLRARDGVIVYVGTSGRIAKRAARGKDRFIDPVPLLKAWGFEVAPGLKVVSENFEFRPVIDSEGAVMTADPNLQE